MRPRPGPVSDRLPGPSSPGGIEVFTYSYKSSAVAKRLCSPGPESVGPAREIHAVTDGAGLRIDRRAQLRLRGDLAHHGRNRHPQQYEQPAHHQRGPTLLALVDFPPRMNHLAAGCNAQSPTGHVIGVPGASRPRAPSSDSGNPIRRHLIPRYGLPHNSTRRKFPTFGVCGSASSTLVTATVRY